MAELESDGRLSIVELAQRVNLTNTPCSERVKRLEREGFIQGYRAVINKDQLGLSHRTVVQVSLVASAAENAFSDFNAAIQRIEEIELGMLIAGSFDYLLIIRTRDMQHFRQILDDKINRLPGILQTNSFAVMETARDIFSGV